jgi:hypothetical protein
MMMRNRSTTPRRGSERGTIYVLVLALLLVLMASGVAAISVARTRTRTIVLSNDALRAGTLAESAVERALAYMNANGNWRTTYVSGVETAQVAFGGGTVSFKLVDECDGTLSGGDTDPVRIYGIGRYGKATQVYSVLAVGVSPLTCLSAPLAVGGTLNCNKATVNAVGMAITANADVNGGQSFINANVEAAGNINTQSWTHSGGSNSATVKRGMPGCSIFDSYTSIGTVIPYTSLPINLALGRKIELCVISPTDNPYGGGLNPSGVYVIDCQNQNLVIRNCRIVGTLVILNPGSSSSITTGQTDAISWVPAVSNYPCLMVKGNIIFQLGGAASLSEASLLTNFNPPSTPYPYPGGGSDVTIFDTYPNQIAGLVYISGNVVATNTGGFTNNVDMMAVGGNCDLDRNTWNLVMHPSFVNAPPPGFTGSGTVYPVVGTWNRELTP